MHRYDVAIVGAGIAGLSLAWHLNKAGKNVVVLDKSARAEGASVRNFGMVWVVGQPAGEMHEIALRSRELWLQAADELGFWLRTCGSLTLAYEPEEATVLEELLADTGPVHGREILPAAAVLDRFPFVRPENLRSALFSPTEVGVDPREVVHAVARVLVEREVDIRWDASVSHLETGFLELSNGESILAEKVVVCAGPQIFDVLPDAVTQAGLIPTRLQMLRLKPKGTHVPAIGIHLCAGLTLGHYANFRTCPSLPSVLDLHKRKWPEQVARGIHVLVAEYPDGTITVGDSHVYGRESSVYRDESTDRSILEAMDEFLPQDRYDIVQRWEGTYNTHPTLPYWWEHVGENIWAFNIFGTGMTLSFGLTERFAQELI